MTKGLEALKHFENELIQNGNYDFKDIDTIEKELKALEIIKEKRIDVNYLIYLLEENLEENYKKELILNDFDLTQEEYNLLKEVLENE